MTFSDLYFTNNDWEKSTVLKINVGTVNQNKELKAYKVLSLYAGYEVVGFTSNWVALIAPVCLSQNKEEKRNDSKRTILSKFKMDTRHGCQSSRPRFNKLAVSNDRTQSFKSIQRT
jgi:hypothetical protein